MASSEAEGHQKYESQRQVQEYLNLHFGSVETQVPASLRHAHSAFAQSVAHFPQRCASLLAHHAVAHNAGLARALDVGCAVGGSTFELARAFHAVVGIDFSAAFIAAAEHLRTVGELAYSVRTEGEQFSHAPLVARAPHDVDAARLAFEVGDACQLDLARLGQFNAVLAGNLICRLPDPRKFLADLSHLVAPGGVVLFTTPFSWFQEYTPRDRWLGGRDGEPDGSSLTGLVAALSADFDLVHQDDIALIIREHARKYQLITPKLTVFKRKQPHH